MKINDKIIAAFLVSAGVFSTAQATQYTKSLSFEQKKDLASVAKVSKGNIKLCVGVWDEQHTNGKTE